ncbi:MAG TPA: adenylate/guanylate cyclase domain-containing protein [Cellulomonas sp.]
MPEPAGDGDDRSTVAALEEALLGGPRTLTADEVGGQIAVAPERVLAYRRMFGLPTAEPGAPVFTEADAAAAAVIAELAREHDIAPTALGELVRSLGHTMDRLVLWQVEALAEDLAERYRLDHPTARLLLLDRLGSLVPELDTLLTYAFHRQLAAVAGRWDTELAEVRPRGAEGELPLLRAVGFADMVSFTRRTAGLGPTDLSAFVERFEAAARDVVAAAGGRVVKTIGDAVLFVADDPATGAQVALGLADRFGGAVDSGLAGEARGVTPVRVSLVWGRVLSRFGDVFGGPVTLAARLTDIAAPSTVWTDAVTAAVLADDERFVFEPLGPREVEGLGRVEPLVLRRP